MTTNIDLCNRALAFAGTRSQLTDLVSTTEGKYCALLYTDLRDFLLRQADYDFALKLGDPVNSGGGVFGTWQFTYNYPTDALRIRGLIPLINNMFDPQPISWNISGTTILTTGAASKIIYTTNTTTEDEWDAIFTDSFVRLLGSGIAFALENRIEAHKVAIQEALEFAQLGAMRDP